MLFQCNHFGFWYKLQTSSRLAAKDIPQAARLGVPSTCAAGSLGEDLCSCASILAMSIVIDYFPVQLSLPKKVIIRNRHGQ